MNAKEILKMEAGPEINRLVETQVMGNVNLNHPGFYWAEGSTEDGKDGWDGFYCPRCGASEGTTTPCVKNYSMDIRVAWEVLEHVTRVPETLEEAEVEANTKFMLLFRAANLWAYTAAGAALQICRMALLATMHKEADPCLDPEVQKRLDQIIHATD